MEYLTLPQTDLKVSKIALGCMRIADKSIEEVGRLLSVNPFRLQTILNNRNKLGIESTKHILSAEEISLCKNTLTELYFIKIKDKKLGFQQ